MSPSFFVEQGFDNADDVIDAEYGEGSKIVFEYTAASESPSVSPSSSTAPSADSEDNNILEVDVSGIKSWDTLDDPSNDKILVALGADSILTGISYDLYISGLGDSLPREFGIAFRDVDQSFPFANLQAAPDTSNETMVRYRSGGIIDLETTPVGQPIGY